jgi:hypothetical protein
MKVVFKKQLTTEKNLPMRKMREEGAGGGSWCPACLRCPSRRSPFPVVCGYLRPPRFHPVVRAPFHPTSSGSWQW